MHKFSLVLLFLSFIIFACHEDGITPPPNGNLTDTLTFIGFRGNYALDMEYEEPFLYVCAGQKGVWKKNISTNGDWHYLGLGDTSFGTNSKRGALNLDVDGSHILVAYSEPKDTCRPDQCVGIWGSTDGGVNWFRSDNGIPESIIDTFEYNVILDLERSPYDPNKVFAIYGCARYVSTNTGSNWTLYGIRGCAANEDHVRWNPFKVNELWIFGVTSTSAPYLAFSRTGGTSFEFGVDFIKLGFPNTGSVLDIAFDKESSLIIYVLIGTLIKSTDGGITWISDGFEVPGKGVISKIIEDKKHSGVLYMGGLNEVFYSKDGASNIYLLTQLPYEKISSLEFDETRNRLFIGTNDGVYSYNLNTIK